MPRVTQAVRIPHRPERLLKVRPLPWPRPSLSLIAALRCSPLRCFDCSCSERRPAASLFVNFHSTGSCASSLAWCTKAGTAIPQTCSTAPTCQTVWAAGGGTAGRGAPSGRAPAGGAGGATAGARHPGGPPRPARLHQAAPRPHPPPPGAAADGLLLRGMRPVPRPPPSPCAVPLRTLCANHADGFAGLASSHFSGSDHVRSSHGGERAEVAWCGRSAQRACSLQFTQM